MDFPEHNGVPLLPREPAPAAADDLTPFRITLRPLPVPGWPAAQRLRRLLKDLRRRYGFINEGIEGVPPPGGGTESRNEKM